MGCDAMQCDAMRHRPQRVGKAVDWCVCCSSARRGCFVVSWNKKRAEAVAMHAVGLSGKKGAGAKQYRVR
jgi:hypothetical protein